MGDTPTGYKIVRGGRVLDIAAGTAEPADILIENDTIREIGRPGVRRSVRGRRDHRRASADPSRAGECAHPWHGNLAIDGRPMDAGTVAGGGAMARRQPSVEETLSATDRCSRDAAEGLHRLLRPVRRISAAEPRKGIAAVADAYAQAGMRAVIAPMMADMTFYEAIPGLDGRAAAGAADRGRRHCGLPPWQEDDRADARPSCTIGGRPTMVRPAVAPTIPLHCSRRIHGCLPRPGHPISMSASTPIWRKSKIQAVAGVAALWSVR